jgi:hypothetical protein
MQKRRGFGSTRLNGLHDTDRMAIVKSLVLLASVALLVSGAGCRKQDPITHYRAAKDPAWRMVAALVPSKNETWFFKMVAPSTRITDGKDEFTRFIQSLNIGDTVAWKLPPGWTDEAGAGGAERRATLRFGKDDPRFEVTVVRLPGDAGGVLANVNRWRGQLGLDPTTEAGLGAQSTTITVSETKVTIVDFEGPRKPAMGPPMAGGAPPERPSPPEKPSMAEYRSMFTYQLPSGWTENPRPQAEGRILEFRAGDDASAALVTLSIFPGQTGDVAMNVNRWRQQAGLDPLGAAAAEQASRSMTFLGREGNYVEILGPSRGIVCAFVLDRQASMFLKLDGAPDVVDRQKALFHAFLETLKVSHKNG